MIDAITKESLHHAYLLEGGDAAVAEVVTLSERLLGMPISGHPDVYSERFESLGVDEARSLREHIFVRPLGGLSITIAHAEQITPEAQNALLKVLEEPPAASVFFLVLSSSARVLPTLRSRMREIVAEMEDTVTGDAKKFLAASPAKRIEMVKGIVEEKDRTKARALLRGVMETLHQEFAGGKQQYAPALEELRRMSDYLGDTAASPKLILEHLALVLPRS